MIYSVEHRSSEVDTNMAAISLSELWSWTPTWRPWRHVKTLYYCIRIVNWSTWPWPLMHNAFLVLIYSSSSGVVKYCLGSWSDVYNKPQTANFTVVHTIYLYILVHHFLLWTGSHWSVNKSKAKRWWTFLWVDLTSQARLQRNGNDNFVTTSGSRGVSVGNVLHVLILSHFTHTILPITSSENYSRRMLRCTNATAQVIVTI